MMNIKNGKVKCIGYNRCERNFTVGKVYDVVDNTITNDNGYTYSHYLSEESIVDWLSRWYKFEAVPTDKIVIAHDGKTTTATLYRGDEKVVTTARCATEDKFDFMVGAKLAMERLLAKANEVIVGGFKVGDRVNWNGHNGTVICISCSDYCGVEFDIPTEICHNCGGVDLKAGKRGTKCTSRWLKPSVLKHGEAHKRYNGKVVCIKADTDHWTVGKVYEVKDGFVTSDKGLEHPRYGEPYRDVEDIRHIGCIVWRDSRHNPGNEFVPLIEN